MKQVKDLLLSEYQENIWDTAYKTMEEYKLIGENDHIAIYIEGNRNSLLTHACVELYKELYKVNFKVTYFLAPSENVSLEQLVEIARDWDIKEYHIVEDQTEKGYMEYIRRCGCNKLVIDLNRDGLMKEYMAQVMEHKRFFEISPIYQMSRFNYLTAIHPFYYVEEKDMKVFAADSEIKLPSYIVKPRELKQRQNPEGIDTKNVFHLNVYQSV